MKRCQHGIDIWQSCSQCDDLFLKQVTEERNQLRATVSTLRARVALLERENAALADGYLSKLGIDPSALRALTAASAEAEPK